MQPVRRYGVDAAILFCDIVVPAAAVGFGVEVEQGRGPVVDRPFRRAEDLARLRPLEPEADTGYVLEAVRLVTAELDPLGIPLIGFAGAPFTVASYLVEGGPSRVYAQTKALMRGDPELFAAAARRPGRHGPGVAARPGAGGRIRRAALRQLGRGAVARRLRAPRPARHAQGLRRAGGPRACPASISASAPASCSR